jgi:formylglycine-generating enzyme required for sulfatase activity/predicted Ser/Thr protein kinase/type II secretory pathway pseudopilin PulG
MIGSQLGNYIISGEVGSGGMGTVFLAHHARLSGRTVAIKVMPEGFAEHPQLVARFEQEANVMCSLNHPNIVKVFDFDDEEGRYYYAMEYVEGRSLDKVLHPGAGENKPLPLDEAIRIFNAICDALEYAHARGVIHRDLKPGNILIENNGSVKLTDFGLAKILENVRKSSTGHLLVESGPVSNTPTVETPPQGVTDMPTMRQTPRMSFEGQALGTAYYMSPEQMDGRLDIDWRADIFALGTMLFEMVTGKIPTGKVLANDLNSALPKELDAVIDKAREYNREKRYQTVAEFRAAFNSVLLAPQRAQRAQREEKGTGPEAAPTARRAPLKIIAIGGVALLALVAVAAVVLWPQYQKRRDDERAAMALLAQATILRTEGKLDEAIAACQDVLSKYPQTNAAVQAKTLRQGIIDEKAKAASTHELPKQDDGEGPYRILLLTGDQDRVTSLERILSDRGYHAVNWEQPKGTSACNLYFGRFTTQQSAEAYLQYIRDREKDIANDIKDATVVQLPNEDDEKKAALARAEQCMKNGQVKEAWNEVSSFENDPDPDVHAQVSRIKAEREKELTAAVNEAQAATDQAKTQYDRSEQLYEQKAISDADYQKAKAEYDKAKAALEVAKTALRLFREGSPGSDTTPPPQAKLPEAPEGFKAVDSEGCDPETKLWKAIEHIKSGIRLRLIPAGEFDMGSNESSDAQPVHRVKISRPFYMGETEVTQAQWQQIMGNKPSSFTGSGDLPVEQVSWSNVQDFLKKAGDGLRLPTEAEWEYACRAGTKGPFNTGDNLSTDQANYDGNQPYGGNPKGAYRKRTTTARTFKPNAYGLYDMHGNVCEWCSDWYGEKYYEECKNGVTDPTGPGNGTGRVVRGGSWYYGAFYTLSAYRFRIEPANKYNYIGFRVVLPVPEKLATPSEPAPGTKLPDAPAGFKAVESEGRDKDTGLWKEIEHIKSGIRLRLIPTGEFDMGSPDTEKDRDKDEGPVHHVKISKPFYMGKYEVTQAQWKAVMGADNNPSNFKGDNLPVETVSWNDAQEFLKKAGDGLRLPSEAEWEFACRAGSKGKWCFGDDENTLGDYAWYNENSGNQTHPVGQKKPNTFGLYDMHGHVWEWCSDWYGEKYYEECKNGVSDPTGPGNGAGRVVRGGSWGTVAWSARSADRNGRGPGDRGGVSGFRVAVPARANE